MKNTMNIQANINGKVEFFEVTIPNGYSVIASGSVMKNDLVYNVGTGCFDIVKMNGFVIAEQLHLVLRSNGSSKVVAAFERMANDAK